MKAGFDFIAKNIEFFFSTLFSLLEAPSRCLPQLVKERPRPLKDSLVFLGVSIAIGLGLQLSWMYGSQEAARLAMLLTLQKGAVILLYAIALYWILRMFGGRGTLADTFCAYLYVISISYLTTVLIRLLQIGLLDSTLRDAWIAGNIFKIMAWARSGNAPEQLLYRFLAAGQLLVPAIWIGVFWRGLIKLHGSHNFGALRSIAAYLVTGLVFVLLLGMVYLIHKAITDGPNP